MQLPLTEDIFHNFDITKNFNKDLISAFVQSINSHYYDAKRGEKHIPYVTGDIIKAAYEQAYNEKPGEEMAMLLDITAEYINEALKQGEKDAAVNEKKGGVI